MVITDEVIRSLSSPQSFARGLELYRSGALLALERQGNLLLGKCEGSSAPSYGLQAEIDAGGVRSASCSCPYDFGGLCKHLVALLLASIHSPDDFSERKPLQELLEGLDREAIVRLLENMVESDPGLYGRLERVAAAGKTGRAGSKPTPKRRKTAVSEATWRARAKTILRSLNGYRTSEAYWMMGGMVDELRKVEETARQFLEDGDAGAALTILTVILEEAGRSYEEFDDSDGKLGDFLGELGDPLAEAILSADLNRQERQAWEARLRPIIEELVNYGIDETAVALTALAEGWEAQDGTYGQGEEPGMDLTGAKMNVLERQGRIDEYLDLCRAAGEYRRYALKLIEIGRTEEALAIALTQFADAGDALAIAQRLRETGEIQGALRVGEQGLGLEGSTYALGTWLGLLEEVQGRFHEAAQAYRSAFDSYPSLDLYKTLRRLAGPGWETLKPDLISFLKDPSHTDALVDVYLEEEEWDAAIALADPQKWNYRQVEKMAEAVLNHRPEWVIRACIGQSDGLLAGAKSKHYPAAARWLQRVKQAYIRMGRQADWQRYLNSLKAQYSRRPALQAELRKL